MTRIKLLVKMNGSGRGRAHFFVQLLLWWQKTWVEEHEKGGGGARGGNTVNQNHLWIHFGLYLTLNEIVNILS